MSSLEGLKIGDRVKHVKISNGSEGKVISTVSAIRPMASVCFEDGRMGIYFTDDGTWFMPGEYDTKLVKIEE
jgi:hypothetical protein